MVNRIAILTLGTMFGLCLACDAMAEREHPRINQVAHRIENQEHRLSAGISSGQIDHWRAARDERRESWIERRLARDESLHDGHITFGEQRRLNRDLDRNSVRLEEQRDPEIQVTRP